MIGTINSPFRSLRATCERRRFGPPRSPPRRSAPWQPRQLMPNSDLPARDLRRIFRRTLLPGHKSASVRRLIGRRSVLRAGSLWARCGGGRRGLSGLCCCDSRGEKHHAGAEMGLVVWPECLTSVDSESANAAQHVLYEGAWRRLTHVPVPGMRTKRLRYFTFAHPITTRDRLDS